MLIVSSVPHFFPPKRVDDVEREGELRRELYSERHSKREEEQISFIIPSSSSAAIYKPSNSIHSSWLVTPSVSSRSKGGGHRQRCKEKRRERFDPNHVSGFWSEMSYKLQLHFGYCTGKLNFAPEMEPDSVLPVRPILPGIPYPVSILFTDPVQ